MQKIEKGFVLAQPLIVLPIPPRSAPTERRVTQ
jgi:hypothetical protein